MSLCLCSLLDYLPLLVSFRRLPHLDAPVMITTSVSNINVSVQLGDTTPFALGFLSACGGTMALLHTYTCTNRQKRAGVCHILLFLYKIRPLRTLVGFLTPCVACYALLLCYISLYSMFFLFT